MNSRILHLGKEAARNWIGALAVLLGLALLVLSGDVWAQSAPGAAVAGGEAPSPWMSMMPLMLVFVVFYFLLIRPQQKRMKEQQAMIGALKTGDEVMTNAGILGKITDIADKVVTLEVADRVRIRMLKSQVAQVVKGPIQDLPEAR